MNLRSSIFRLHRWLALVASLPLAIVLVTGLILSFEPLIVTQSIVPRSLTAEKMQSAIAAHDPNGQARVLVYRSYDNALTIASGRTGGTTVDMATGKLEKRPSAVASFLTSTRRMHETLLIDASWLVVTSTGIMLAIAALGTLLGWPRLSNTLSGWHKGLAWGALPLVILSPLTGLFIAGGITFVGQSAPTTGPGEPTPTLMEAVQIVGKEHDLSGLVWLRPQGGRVLARIVENGEYRLYAVTAQGAVALPRNWPRLWHEGNFAGAASALMNVVLSVTMIALLITGVWIWLRRTLRRRPRSRAHEALPA